jgi:hypothetical protein
MNAMMLVAMCDGGEELKREGHKLCRLHPSHQKVKMSKMLAHVAAAELQDQVHMRFSHDQIMELDDAVMSKRFEEGRLSDDSTGNA